MYEIQYESGQQGMRHNKCFHTVCLYDGPKVSRSVKLVGETRAYMWAMFLGGLQIQPAGAKPPLAAQITKPLFETTTQEKFSAKKKKKKKKSQILPTSNNPDERSALNNPTTNVTQAR